MVQAVDPQENKWEGPHPEAIEESDDEVEEGNEVVDEHGEVNKTVRLSAYVYRVQTLWSVTPAWADIFGSLVALNSASTAGENRKAALDQDGQARQSDIVGRTEEGHEAYYGELKVFFLGAKVTNTVVHTRISNLTMPTCLSELRLLDQTFFSGCSRFVISPDYQHAFEAKATGAYGGQQSVPELATPLRNVALGIQFKVKVAKRKGKQTMESKEAKRSKETVEV
ncbi:hypothetical protein BGX30_001312 [Mortierella sp. GBA39]|nr:hypothetical protein BGX30_001312 [Mortierella sp. GBA39]